MLKCDLDLERLYWQILSSGVEVTPTKGLRCNAAPTIATEEAEMLSS